MKKNWLGGISCFWGEKKTKAFTQKKFHQKKLAKFKSLCKSSLFSHPSTSDSRLKSKIIIETRTGVKKYTRLKCSKFDKLLSSDTLIPRKTPDMVGFWTKRSITPEFAL